MGFIHFCFRSYFPTYWMLFDLHWPFECNAIDQIIIIMQYYEQNHEDYTMYSDHLLPLLFFTCCIKVLIKFNIYFQTMS